VLARKALAHVVMESLDMSQEVVLLQEQFVADETFEGLPVV
jgi:predicted Zn-dependent protease with MMP-like domain